MICRAKAGGWCTTTAVAVAAGWPDPRWRLVVEADTSGGTIVSRAGIQPAPGLVELAARARPGAGVDVLATCTQRLRCGVPVVAGPVRARQAAAAVNTLCAAPDVLAGAAGTLVIVDVGQLAPEAVAWPLTHAADGALVCAPPTLDGLAAAAGLAGELCQACPRVWLAVCGPGDYPDRQVAEAMAPVPLVAHLPADPHVAAGLWSATSLPGRRSRLRQAADDLARRLATDLPVAPTPQPRTAHHDPAASTPAASTPPAAPAPEAAPPALPSRPPTPSVPASSIPASESASSGSSSSGPESCWPLASAWPSPIRALAGDPTIPGGNGHD